MGKLRQKMINDMVVRGFSERTRASYLRVVVGLVRHYRCSPDRLTAEQVQAYLAHLHCDRKLAWSSCSVAAYGLRFFYHTTLGRSDTVFVVPAPRVQSRLPQILSADEIVRILEATRTVKHRVLLMTAYAAGLRVSELVALRVDDIDADRGTIRVVQGKGMRDRYTLLSPRLLSELRAYWKASRSYPWLFPARDAHAPICVRTAQRIFSEAKSGAGVVKSGGIHGLRHAFATHLLEAGTDIYTIQHLLGHRQIASTLRYIHLTQNTIAATRSPLDLLFERRGTSVRRRACGH